MTAQRFVRGSKARIVIGICVVSLIVGVIFHYENTITQIDNIKKSYDICTQQQESLSIQLQVIVDYKSRLEKSLQTEKLEHKQTRAELESRINDEKLRRDKTSIEANLRFSSLQQNYNLLQAKHDDQKEKSDKLHQQYRDETDKLQAKVKELQEQIKQFEKDKEKSLERLKTEYMQLQLDKKHLEEKLKGTTDQKNIWENKLNHLEKENKQLQRENEILKRGSNTFDKLLKPIESENAINQQKEQPVVTTLRNFAKQVEIANNVYQIQGIKNSPLDAANHDIVELDNAQQIDAPKLHQNQIYDTNNVESNVLQKPKTSSKLTVKASSPSNGVLAGAQPLLLPTVTSSTKSKKVFKNPIFDNSLNVLQPPNNLMKKVKLPDGVVPIPKERLQNNEELPQKVEKTEEKNIPDEINFALPNRYRNNILESEIDKENAKETKVENKKPNINNNNKQILHNEPEVNGGDINNQDNAMEVIDQPKNHLQEDPLHLMDGNQNLERNDVKAQEVEQSIKEPMAQHLDNRKFKKQHIDTLRFAERPNEAVVRAPPGGAIYEAEGDYDKDGHKEDLQLEEQEPEGEEDDDADDYDGHLAARQKDPAVRN